jgi:quinol monooxygenase YgiN
VSELQGIARFKFDDGMLEEFKRLSAQCIEIVRTKDTGTLQYQIYFNDDQSECIVLERHKDSEALIQHAANVGDLMQAILAAGSSPANSSVSRAPTSERSWPVARSVSSRPSGRCNPLGSTHPGCRHPAG